RLILGDRWIANRCGALTHPFDLRVVDGFVAVLLQSGPAPHETHGRAMIDGKLALEAARDVSLVTEIQDERRNPEPHDGDVVGREPMIVVDLDAAVDRWVVHDAAGKRLVRVR